MLFGYWVLVCRHNRSYSSPFVSSVDIGSILQQILHGIDSVEAGSEMEWGREAAFSIAAVDVVGRTQTLG